MWKKFSKSEKLEVFVRYCHYSNASAHKQRHEGFSHEACFHNLIETADLNRVHLTFLLDEHYGKGETHFVEKQSQFPVVKINAGCESKSFLALLDYVLAQNLSDATPLYFLEDDYLHRPGWSDILFEGFSLPGVDYLTLFDHRDKYTTPEYQKLASRLWATDSCHWRATPSTTNTYAMRLKTLKKHLSIHQKFSEEVAISKDHEKFLALGKAGATLISSIPGYSTHAEPDYTSPCYDWGSLFFQNTLN